MDKDIYEKLVKEKDFKFSSIMQGISFTNSDFLSLEEILGRVADNPEFSDVEIKMDEEDEDKARITLTYLDQQHQFLVDVRVPVINELLTISHDLTETELLRIQNAGLGLGIETHFGTTNLNSFHLQIKLIHTILPNIAGIVDYSSCCILSGRWVTLAAQSSVPPSPDNMFRIHAVSDRANNNVWLHTHGLNRCGSVELEIPGAGIENNEYQSLWPVINTMAARIIENGLESEELEPICVGNNLVATWRKWEDSINENNFLGCSQEDRKDHDDPSGFIYLYMSEEDYKKGVLTHPNAAAEFLANNPLFYFSDGETERMQNLAQERISYFCEHGQAEQNTAMIKAGIVVDEEHRKDNEITREFLWFEIDKIEDEVFSGVLKNQPYYISNLNENDRLKITKAMVTDWIIYTPERQVTPDSAYLFEKSPVLADEILRDKEKLDRQFDIWEDSNQPNKVIETFQLLENPDYEITHAYARALNNLGASQKAIEALMQVEEEGKNDHRWHYKMAYAYNQLDDYDGAEKSLKEAIRIKPTHTHSWYELGFLYKLTERYSEAIEAYEKCLEVEDDEIFNTESERKHIRITIDRLKALVLEQ